MSWPINMDKIFQGLTKVSFRGGVVGRTTFIIGLVCVLITSIILFYGVLWFACAGITVMVTFAFIFLWRLINFADRNPQAALLEGSQLVTLRKIEQSSKNQPSFTASEIIPEQPEPIESSPSDLLPDHENTEV